MLIKQDRRRFKTDLSRARPWFKTRSGIRLTMRLLQREDRLLLIEFFDLLSPETRWRRFHTNVEHVTREYIEQRSGDFVDVDNRTLNGAVVAAYTDKQGEHIVGVVRLARPAGQPEAPEAEAAVVVRDDFQGQGVGRELLRRGVLLAKQMKVKTLVAIFQPYNAGAIQLFRELNLPSTISTSHAETTMRIEVPYTL